MGPCAVPIASRILKLHQKLLNNILYGNPEGFLDIPIVNKMTEILKNSTIHNYFFVPLLIYFLYLYSMFQVSMAIGKYQTQGGGVKSHPSLLNTSRAIIALKFFIFKHYYLS